MHFRMRKRRGKTSGPALFSQPEGRHHLPSALLREEVRSLRFEYREGAWAGAQAR